MKSQKMIGRLRKINLQNHTQLMCLHGFVFFIAHFFLLLNNGVYWDDYTLIGTEILGVKARLYAAGLPFAYYLNWLMSFLHHTVWWYHFAIYVLYLIANWYLIKIAQRFFNFETIKVVVFIFILNTVCFNTNKILISCFHYTVAYAVASYVLYQFYGGLEGAVLKKIWVFILSLIAFTTPSFLFYLPVTYFMLLFHQQMRNSYPISLSAKYFFGCFIQTFKNIKKLFWLCYAGALVMFFGVKKIFPLQSMYQDYNKISFNAPVSTPVNNHISLVHKMINRAISILHEVSFFSGFSLVISVVVTVFFLFIVYKIKIKKENISDTFYQVLINVMLFGFILLAAVFPYMLVHKTPTFLEFGNRHQLLMPFGFSGLVVSLFSFFKSKFFRVFCITTLVFVQTFFLSSFFVKYQVAEFRDVYLIHQFKAHQAEFSKGIILFNNQAPVTNEVISMLFMRNYSLSGMYRWATNKQDILFVAPKEFDSLAGNSPYIVNLPPLFLDSENIRDYKCTSAVSGEITFAMKQDINSKNLIKWMFMKYFGNRKQLLLDLDNFFVFTYKSS